MGARFQSSGVIDMRNVKMILSYCGTAYLGWQKTNCGPSIEETLEQALQTILQHPVKLQAASRTDAGVRTNPLQKCGIVYHQMEINYGEFERILILPQVMDMEHIKAELKEGFLYITLRKKEIAVKKEG